MHTTRWMFTVLCLTLGAYSSAGAAASPVLAGDRMPNVVFFLADDIGWADVGFYHRWAVGTPNAVPTPNLDRLAAEGMVFTDAHTPAGLCAPNRFSFITGSNPYRSRPAGTWNRTATSGLDFGSSENHRIQNPHRTVGEVMQAAGYRTSFFGKMHFGGDFFNTSGGVVRGATTPTQLAAIDYTRNFENGLRDHGFDHTFVTPDGIQGPLYAYFEDDRWAGISTLAGSGQIPGVDVGANSFMKTWLESDSLGHGEFITDGYGDSEFDTSEHGSVLAYRARDFIDTHLTTHPDTPFLLYYAAPAIHVPLTPSAAGYIADGSTGLGPRGDFVVDLDAQIGLILDRLDSSGVAGNTLVIFSSDNGGTFKATDGMVTAGQRPNGPLRAAKGSIYEGGHRVPLIWKWGDGTPGGSVIPPGTVCNQMVSAIDWVSSMVDLTGRMTALDQHFDSTSLLPLAFSDNPDAEPPPHTYLYQKTNHSPAKYGVHIRDDEGRWFYVRYRNGDQDQELYHLDTDLGQSTNLLDGLVAPGDIPVDHAYKARVTAANSWFLAHDTYADARTSPVVDYRHTNSPVDWVRHGDFEGAPDVAQPPNDHESWNVWQVASEASGFHIQVREITPPDDGNLLSGPSDAGLPGAHSGEKAIVCQYYYDGATMYQDLGGFTLDTNQTATLSVWIAPYEAHGSNTDDALIIRVRALQHGTRPEVKSQTIHLDTLPEDTWTQVTVPLQKSDLAGMHGSTPRLEFEVADAHKWRFALDDIAFTPGSPTPDTLAKTPVPINVPPPQVSLEAAPEACTVFYAGARVGATFTLQRNSLLDAPWDDRQTFEADSDTGSRDDEGSSALDQAYFRLQAPGRFYRYDLTAP